MVSRRVLLIGDHRHCEFSQAIEWLTRHTLVSLVATPTEAMTAIRYPAQSPELIIVAQSRPSQFALAEIEALHRLAPLARLAVLTGSWCEGELRTGHPWPGVLRIYWHQGVSRISELLADANPLWSHPRTATEVERMLAQPPPSVHGAQKLIAIGTETSIAYQGLAGTCAQAGFSTAWLAPGHAAMIQGAVAGIWDETQRPGSLGPLHQFARHLSGAPIVALLNFPRLADYQRLRDEGIRQIIAKPFMNSDLMGVIEQQLKTPAAACPPQAVA